jgi:hypothetical protein
MKGWCQLALKVFLYACGAAIGGLCVAFGIGAHGGSLVSATLPGAVNAPVSALSNGSGNGSAT